MGLPSNCMESQCSVEETCSDRFFCGESESFLRVIFPRTPSRCYSGSTLAPSSYLVNVNASRSSARQLTTEAQKTQRTQKNFTPVSPLFYVAFALPLQRAQHPLPPRRSTTELFLASESRPGNHTFWQPDRTIHSPLAFRSSRVRAMFVTFAMGRCSLAPADDFATVPVTPAARLSGITTPSAPEASAVRRIAPRLCGSSTPSSTMTSEYCPRFAAITSSKSAYCFDEVTATTP